MSMPVDGHCPGNWLLAPVGLSVARSGVGIRVPMVLRRRCRRGPAGTAPAPPRRRHAEPSEAPCPQRNPLRNVYFGDLHVHTTWSFDAHLWDTRTTPDDAYRFARGAPLALPPLDAEGHGTRTVQLARPLDFTAVTDHSEFLGEVETCTHARLGDLRLDRLPAVPRRRQRHLHHARHPDDRVASEAQSSACAAPTARPAAPRPRMSGSACRRPPPRRTTAATSPRSSPTSTRAPPGAARCIAT